MKYLSLCLWNLNSLAAYNFTKVSALKVFNVKEKKIFFLCLSESYLNSTIPSDDGSVSSDGYNLICADHLKKIKQGGVLIYYRETLPIKTIQESYLPECLVPEVNYEDKKNIFYFISVSQSKL